MLPSFIKDHWYRLLFVACLAGPALVCQGIKPIIATDTWETLSETAYAAMMYFRAVPVEHPAQVAVIEIDQHTLDAYGWPIDRSLYARLFSKLKAAGHPWILSLLHFQAIAKAHGTQPLTTDGTSQDATLKAAIRDYGRYVGTGLVIDDTSHLDPKAEDHLMPRVTLSRSGDLDVDLPDLPLKLVEDEQFIAPQLAFGFGALFGVEPVIHCARSYLTDKQQTAQFLIPSALTWIATFGTYSRLQTTSGAFWPRRDETPPYQPRETLGVAYKECLTETGVTTLDALQSRGIHRYSMADVLEGATAVNFSDKVVVLAPIDMRRFRGPGGSDSGKAVVEEHLLLARFLDGIMSKNIIARDPLFMRPTLDWLPLALAAILLLFGLLAPRVSTAALSSTALVGLTLISYYQLASGVYLVPIQGMTSTAASAVACAALTLYLSYYRVRRQVRFSVQLRESLAQCNRLSDIESKTQAVCAGEFRHCKIQFVGFDRELYDAAEVGAAALTLLDRRQGAAPLPAKCAEPTLQVRPPSVWKRVAAKLYSDRHTSQIDIESRAGYLGTITVHLTHAPHETDLVRKQLSTIKTEVTQHWHRIKTLLDQSLLDYKLLREQARGEILARFLAKVLVSKFSDGRTMEENLQHVMKPRATRAALLQADIRGYTQISNMMSPAEMVALLQSYFRNVVDAAQRVAQVKLIGDCIFLFIEEENATGFASAADIALELATVLVDETHQRNSERVGKGHTPIDFGIAIHYGDVIVGNLSSDSCIDYTVIGPNVNLVARLEELSKNINLASKIGPNGVLISQDAMAAMVRYANIAPQRIDLAAIGARVRSFSSVQFINAITAPQAISLRDDKVLTLAPMPVPAAG